jgi:quinol monooxygenase YgiN
VISMVHLRTCLAERTASVVDESTCTTDSNRGMMSQSVERPNQFVLIEAFRDRAAGEAHVHSEPSKAAMAWMPDVVAETPEIIHVEAPRESWSTMAELQPRTAQ